MNEKNIRASNLMLGDWVYAGERLKNVQVARIYEHSICTEDGFWESEEVDESMLQPIPLTWDFFEKIGFERTKEFEDRFGRPISSCPILDTGIYSITRYVDNDNIYFSIGIEKTVDSKVWMECRLIKYVHEFQHIVKECGGSLYINIDNNYNEYEDW